MAYFIIISTLLVFFSILTIHYVLNLFIDVSAEYEISNKLEELEVKATQLTERKENIPNVKNVRISLNAITSEIVNAYMQADLDAFENRNSTETN